MNKLVEAAAIAVSDVYPLIINGFKPSEHSEHLRANWRASAIEIAQAAVLAFLEAALEDEGVIEALSEAQKTAREDDVAIYGADARMIDPWSRNSNAALRALIQQVSS